MQKIYRILRDNKEKGPFTLEELVALSLKPYDLIWVDGRSAGWRYPSEIDAVKPFLEQKEATPQNEAPATLPQIHPASHSSRLNASPQIIQPEPEPVSMISSPDSADEILTSEKLERKAAEIYQRIQAFTEKQQQNQESTQIKYSRSLDDLKQEYADWLHKKKKRKNFKVSQKGIIVACCIVSIAIAGFWLFASSAKSKSAENLIPQQPDSYITNAVYIHPAPSEEKKIPERLHIMHKAQVSNPENKEGQSIDKYIDSIEGVLARQNKSAAIYHKRKPANAKKELVQKYTLDTNKNAGVTGTLPGPKKINTSLPQLVNMNARYTFDNNKHITGLEVTIQNNSSELLKTVAVDVFYYKRGERLFDKETLHFSNIQPGNSFTLSTPGNNKAVSARFQLGQVQAD